MRRLITSAVLVCLGMLAVAGCDGNEPLSLDEFDPDSGVVETVPSCPLSAAQVSEIVGLTVVDRENCAFADPDGVAQVTITASTKAAGVSTYEFERKRADAAYDMVKDLDAGEMAFLAVGEAEAEVYVVTAAASYTVLMMSFDLSSSAYEHKLLQFLAAVTK